MDDSVVYYSGHVVTMSDRIHFADSFAVQNGRIIAVGSEAEVRQQVPQESRSVDLAGHTVIPGLFDTHCHFTMGIFAPLWPDCGDRRFGRLISMPGQGWIRGRQLSYPFCHPSLTDIDMLIRNRPAIIVEQGYHGCVLNSAARKLLCTGPNGSHFAAMLDRPETVGASTLTSHTGGTPESAIGSSAVFETAMGWAENVSRDWFQERYSSELLVFAEQQSRRFLAHGITCVCDAAVTPNMARLLMQAHAARQLLIPVVMMVVGAGGFYERPWDRLNGLPTGEGNDELRIGSLKLFVDGGRQCLLVFPDGEKIGFSYYDCESMTELMTKALRSGFSLACHAMGNGAVALALEAYSTALRAAPAAKFPLRIEHATMLTPSLIKRMADMGVIAVVQPHWIKWLGQRWLEAPHKHVRFLPFRALVDAGVLLAGSSDSTDGAVISPFDSIASAVSRRATPESVLDEDQSLTPEEAISLYTRNAAIACGMIEDRGTLEIGKRADFVILSGNPLNRGELATGLIRVTKTYLAGKLLFSAES